MKRPVKSRVLFLGTGNLVRSLMEVICSNKELEIVGLITSTKVISTGKFTEPIVNVNYTDLENFCNVHHIRYEIIPHLETDKYLDEIVSFLRPEIVFVAGWHRIISDKLIQKSNFYGFHASLLPKNAGWAPLVWALINNEKDTGVSLFKIDSGIDTGPIVDQIQFSIDQNMTILDLINESITVSKILLERNIEAISRGTEKLTSQELRNRTEGIRRFPRDGKINFHETAKYVDRFIRAQTRPYFGCYIDIDQKRIRIFKSIIAPPLFDLHDDKQFTPGALKIYNDEYFIKCADDWLKLLDFEIEEINSIKQYHQDSPS